MISIFCKMTPRHYDQYIEHFHLEDPAGRCDLVKKIQKKFMKSVGDSSNDKVVAKRQDV